MQYIYYYSALWGSKGIAMQGGTISDVKKKHFLCHGIVTLLLVYPLLLFVVRPYYHLKIPFIIEV